MCIFGSDCFFFEQAETLKQYYNVQKSVTQMKGCQATLMCGHASHSGGPGGFRRESVAVLSFTESCFSFDDCRCFGSVLKKIDAKFKG